MLYITHDTHHKVDYVFIRDNDDLINSVAYYQQEGATITVVSCSVNTIPVNDTEGNSYDAGKAIILWIEGGTQNTSETVRIEYTTVGGRRLDEEVVFRVVSAD
jgi:hypothetical protein